MGAPAALGVAVLVVLVLVAAVAVLARRAAAQAHRAEDAERDRARSVERAERLLQAAEAVVAATTREEVAAAVAEAAVEGRASWAAVLVEVDAPPRLRVLAVASVPGAVDPTWPDVPLDAPTPLTGCVGSGRAIFLRSRAERLDAYPGNAATLDPRRRSWAYLPLRDELGATTGVLGLGWDDPQAFAPEDRSFLAALARTASEGLTRFAAREQAELVRLAAALDHMIDGVAISTAVRDASGAIVDFAIGYFKPVTMPASAAIGAGGAPRSLLEAFPMLVGSELLDALVRVVETGVAEVIDAYDMPVTIPGRPQGLTVYVQIAPFGDGVLVVTRDITDREQVDRELRESRRMLEAAQRLARIGSWRVDTATGTVQLSPEMLRILGFDPTGPPPGVQDLVARVHPDDRAGLVDVIGRARVDPRPFRAELRIVRGDGTVVRAVGHGDVERDPLPDGSVAERPTAWWGTLQDVTAQREAQEEASRQHTLVELLQRAILPEALPEVPGLRIDACYRPAGTEGNVGGDWYDVVPLDDGRVVVSVGDVAGHGVRSAATMTSLRNAARAYSWQGLGPGETLTRLHQLARGTAPSTFATVVLAVYDPATPHVRWASAGHPPPLVVRDGVPVVLDVPTGPPIGVDLGPASDYGDHVVDLPPGATLVLYSDGLVERRGEVLDDGIGRLVATAAAQHAGGGDVSCDALVDALVGAGHEDDVCVVSLHVC